MVDLLNPTSIFPLLSLMRNLTKLIYSKPQTWNINNSPIIKIKDNILTWLFWCGITRWRAFSKSKNTYTPTVIKMVIFLRWDSDISSSSSSSPCPWSSCPPSPWSPCECSPSDCRIWGGIIILLEIVGKLSSNSHKVTRKLHNYSTNNCQCG